MAVGRDMKGKKNNVISVIGDGAITGGMAYEAMNHAGFLDSNMIIILNDNQQVCGPAQLSADQLQLGVCCLIVAVWGVTAAGSWPLEVVFARAARQQQPLE